MKPDEAMESHEHLHHTAHGGEHEGGHGGGATSGRKIAILIAVLAAILAIVESGGKAKQTEQLAKNIDASDTYAFYQAKKIRSTVLRNSAAVVEAVIPEGVSPERKAKLDIALAKWKEDADRLETDPKTGEGGKELIEKAKRIAGERDEAAMASASVITGMPVLTIASLALGGIGTALGAAGWFAPDALHNLMHGGHGDGHGDAHGAAH